MKRTSLERLQAWQMANEFGVLVCKEILPMLPGMEQYALSQQLRRSAQSIPANIAETHGRYHYQDAIRFCYIARGSLDETRSHLLFAFNMGYLSEDRIITCREAWRDTARLLNGYIKYLNDNLRREKGTSLREEGQQVHEAFEDLSDH